MYRYRIYLSFVGLAIWLYAAFYFLGTHTSESDGRVLRIYNWAHYLPDSVIRAFEKQEGVRVIYDVYDAIETLEAKLLAARSGYDLVFPPLLPTGAIFLKAGAFSKLDLTLLPNRRHLDPAIMQGLARYDLGHAHFMPYLWGTTGLVFHKRKVRHLAPDAPLKSWRLLFDLSYARRFKKCGLILLDSPADVFSDLLLFAKKDPGKFLEEDLNGVAKYLRLLRPYVSRFTSADTMQDMLSERLCVAEIFSTYAHMAIQKIKSVRGRSPYVYVIPEEGAMMWIDVMAIPKDAPNKKLAHRFINFLMQPHVMAEVTNQIYAASAIQSAQKYVKSWIRADKTIYPSADVMKKLHLDALPSRQYERKRLRLWTLIKSGY